MLSTLLEKFRGLLANPERAVINYQALKERLVGDDAGAVCSIISKRDIYKQMYPDLWLLATIALTMPMSTAWPERGFSAMARIKTKMRNRLLDVSLCALMNVSLNGPPQLGDDDALAIAESWISRKHRRNIQEKLQCLSDDEGGVDSSDEDSLDSSDFELDGDRFLL